jgi:hypothetical protein
MGVEGVFKEHEARRLTLYLAMGCVYGKQVRSSARRVDPASCLYSVQIRAPINNACLRAAHPLSDLASAVFLNASLLSSSPLPSNVAKCSFNYRLNLVLYVDFEPSDLKTLSSLGQQPEHSLIFDLTRVEVEVRNWRIRPFFKGVLIIIFAFETSEF